MKNTCGAGIKDMKAQLWFLGQRARWLTVNPKTGMELGLAPEGRYLGLHVRFSGYCPLGKVFVSVGCLEPKRQWRGR